MGDAQTAAAAPPMAGLCLDCNYPLQGLTSHCCPECGRPFDPAKPWTMEARGPVGPVGRWCRRHLNVAHAAALVWGATACLVLLAWVWLPWAPFPIGVVLALLVAAKVWRVALVRWEINYGSGNADPPPRSALPNVAAWLALSVILLSTLHAQSCPHGTAVGAFGVGVAHSDSGGPCRNGRVRSSYRVVGSWYVYTTFR